MTDFRSAVPLPPACVELNRVSLIRDRRRILSDITLMVFRGDFLAITGPNGGGKTTLLRIILGLQKPSSGTVKVDSAMTIGYLPQKNSIDSHFPVTVREVIESGLIMNRELTDKMKKERVDEALLTVGMENFAERPIGRLSGGQLQRSLLGRALIGRPGLLVLDEPLSYVDKHFEEKIYEIIAGVSKHTTILLVSHEMSTISTMANRHIIVDHTITECRAAHHCVPAHCD